MIRRVPRPLLVAPGRAVSIALGRALSVALGRAVSVVALLASPAAHAQETDAERLFREGQEAMAKKDYSIACARFAASNQLEPGIGTRLWLADCYEKQGRLASAWRVFREAAAAAIEAKDSRATVAESRAAQLEPKLAKIVVHVVAPPKDFELRLDGVRVQWALPLFVDRGRHELRATGGFERVVDVDQDGRTYEVTIGHASPTAPADKPSPSAWPIAGWSLVAVGAVGVGAGSYLGLRARSQYDDAASHCPSTCDSEGYDARKAAFRTATASTIFMVAGGVLAVSGITVLILAPPPKKPASEPVGPSFSLRVGAAALSLEGAF